MTKATIKTKHTEITIESDRETIKEIALALQRREEFKGRFVAERERRQKEITKPSDSPKSATGAILKLKSEDYFKVKRSLLDIQKKLEEEGFIYPNTTLSPLLLKLVKRGELGRISEGGVWMYVQR